MTQPRELCLWQLGLAANALTLAVVPGTGKTLSDSADAPPGAACAWA